MYYCMKVVVKVKILSSINIDNTNTTPQKGFPQNDLLNVSNFHTPGPATTLHGPVQSKL